MFCSYCLNLKGVEKKYVEKLQNYFESLTPNTYDLITVSKICRELDVDEAIAIEILQKCLEAGILEIGYGIRCPECGKLIKRINSPDYQGGVEECYSCGETIDVGNDDIVVLFKLNSDLFPFDQGQHENLEIVNQSQRSYVALSDRDTLTVLRQFLEPITEVCVATLEKDNNAKLNEQKVQTANEKALRRYKRNKFISLLLNSTIIVGAVIIGYKILVKVDNEFWSVTIAISSLLLTLIFNYVVKEIFSTDLNYIQKDELKKLSKKDKKLKP